MALPEKLYELPTWIYIPLKRYLRLKQRNWPTKTVKRSTHQLFNRLFKLFEFFIRGEDWKSWEQLCPRWPDNYIDTKLREGLASTSINWDLIALRVFCRFLINKGYDIPKSIPKMSLLDEPRRLPPTSP